ncbi:hypothetical protein PENTCL1PPCAC_8695, partial [Pristionchus entomophagus]
TTLTFTQEDEWIDGLTNIYQVEDGTCFYYDGCDFYVKAKGDKFHSKMYGRLGYGDPIIDMDASGNALFFVAGRKIYKATFFRPRIEIAFVRNMKKDEMVHHNLIYTMQHSRLTVGKVLAYRMYQDPEKHGVEIPENRISTVLGVVGKYIFYGTDSGHWTWLWKANTTEFLVKVSGSFSDQRCFVYARNGSSKCIYVTNGHGLAIIREGIVEQLPFSGIDHIHSIIGVHNGILTVMGVCQGSRRVCTAKLPEGYYDHECTVGRAHHSHSLTNNTNLKPVSVYSTEEIRRMQQTIHALREENETMRHRIDDVEEK